MPNDKIHQLTCLGALLFIVGVFLPLASLPVVGDISYYRLDSGGMLGDIVGKATDPLKNFAADLFMNINEFSWGGFVFIIGLLIMTIGAFMTTMKARK